METRVMLVDADPARSALLERALLDAHYQVVARLDGSADLLAKVREIKPDVIIIDLESPDRDTLESMRHITRELPRPIVMFAENSDADTIEAAVRAGVSAYVVDGLAGSRVQSIVQVAIARFREYQALRDELTRTKVTLEERKLMDRAKGILMKQRGCTEDEAYKALRKLAMDRNQRIAEVARDVIAISELLNP